MFGLGTYELLIVAVIVLLLFGSRLPKVMRSLGQGVTEFKKGLQGVEDPADRAAGKIEERPATSASPQNEAKPSEEETPAK